MDGSDSEGVDDVDDNVLGDTHSTTVSVESVVDAIEVLDVIVEDNVGVESSEVEVDVSVLVDILVVVIKCNVDCANEMSNSVKLGGKDEPAEYVVLVVKVIELITMSVLCTDCASAGGGVDDTSSKIHLIPVSNKAIAFGVKGKTNASDSAEPVRHAGYVHVSSTIDDFDLGSIVDIKCCVSTGATSGSA